MKAVVAAFNQEKALVGAFSVITNLRMELFEALVSSVDAGRIINTWRHLVVTAESGKEEGKSTVNAYHQV